MEDHSSTDYGRTKPDMMLAKLLWGVVFFTAVVSLAAVSADWEEKLESNEEFDMIDNAIEVEENEKPSFDNAVDMQEG